MGGDGGGAGGDAAGDGRLCAYDDGGGSSFPPLPEGTSYAFRLLRVTRTPSRRAQALNGGRPTVRHRPATLLEGCYRSHREVIMRRSLQTVLRRPIKGERPLAGWSGGGF